MDTEKVIKGLECCTFILGKRKCSECPYQKDLPDNGCYQLQNDFHILLKEQENQSMDKLRIENAELIQRILQLENDLAKERAYNYALVTVIRNNCPPEEGR